ncbi:MAG TPA: radical SAM family heme chaperone HemW [Candidatus Omnitrophota bacterium]|nr:radical SAM family heme chaperone HemW [Candidatus Omnitrophota bacterium]
MKQELSLYVHIPFCEKKCFYCSFVVSVGQERRMGDYLKCLREEASRHKGKTLCSVYFGGGTPTFLSDHQLESLLAMVVEVFDVGPNIEWSVEANPEHLSKDKLNILKRYGVNRISLGVQTFNESFLRFLGRNHTRSKAIEAYELIRQAGFHNVNVDLMFGYPKQTIHELREDLKEMVRLKSEHMSLYALTVEERSRFFAEGMKLPQDELVGRFYMEIKDTLERAGFGQYEVSNFALPGHESRHNIHYWKGGFYIGLGVGAHSHRFGRRWWNISRLTDYLQRMEEGQSVEEDSEELTPRQRFMERILFGLRMNEGVDLRAIETGLGQALTDEQNKLIETYIQKGLLIERGDSLQVSDRGRLVLDELCAQLI